MPTPNQSPAPEHWQFASWIEVEAPSEIRLNGKAVAMAYEDDACLLAVRRLQAIPAAVEALERLIGMMDTEPLMRGPEHEEWSHRLVTETENARAALRALKPE